MFGCRHKYGEIKDGYQYCTKCGTAKVAPKRECEHRWVQLDKYEVSNIIHNNVFKTVYVMQCEKCGDIKKVSTSDV